MVTGAAVAEDPASSAARPAFNEIILSSPFILFYQFNRHTRLRIVTGKQATFGIPFEAVEDFQEASWRKKKGDETLLQILRNVKVRRIRSPVMLLRKEELPVRAFTRANGVIIAILAVASLLWHALLWQTYPPDFIEYLLPWYQYIRLEGFINAFGTPFSNYTPAYLYLLAGATLTDSLLEPFDAIKLLSVLGSLFLGCAMLTLLRAMNGRSTHWVWALTVFLLPSAVINSAKLGQCDALWTGACVFAVAFAVRGHLPAMLIWAGLAVSFKAQAAFLAPFLFAVLIYRKASWQLWLIPPAVYAVVMTPAWLAGWPASDLLLVYFRQANELPGFISAAPQPWIVVRWLRPEWTPQWFWVGYAAAIIAAAGIAMGLRRHLATTHGMLLVALLSTSLLPFLLPKMHERYLLLADVLALCLALSARSPSTIALAAVVQSASLLALAGYTHSAYLPLLVGFLAASTGLWLTAVLLRWELQATPEAK